MGIVRSCASCGKLNRIPGKHVADTGKCGACKAPLPPLDEPIAVGPGEFTEIVRDSKVPVLVDFWASWCRPCNTAAPEVARVARDMSGRAVVLKVDTQEFPGLAARYDVRCIPNFALFARGELRIQKSGVVEANTMKSWIARSE